jgi:hypothetical protein
MPCKFKFLSGTIVKHLIDFKENRDIVANAGATISAFDISDLKNNPDYKAARIDNLIQKPIHFSDLRNMIISALKTSV